MQCTDPAVLYHFSSSSWHAQMSSPVINKCPLCNNNVNTTELFQALGDKGCKAYQAKGISCIKGQKVHKQCRIDFCKRKPDITPTTSQTRAPVITRSLPSQEGLIFNIETCCLFCGHPFSSCDHRVETLIFQETLDHHGSSI